MVGALLASSVSGALLALLTIDLRPDVIFAFVGGTFFFATLCFAYGIVPSIIAATLIGPLIRWMYRTRHARLGASFRWMAGTVLLIDALAAIFAGSATRMGLILVGAVPLFLFTALGVLDRRVREIHLSSTKRP